ncbi:MAG: hypothetical protein V4642_08345 [Bacteroidota bacterium]
MKIRLMAAAAIISCAVISGGCTRTQKNAQADADSALNATTVPDSIIQNAQTPNADAPTAAEGKQLEENIKQADASLEAMTLTPSIENKPEGILFVLNAKRNRSVGKEWMPSSEQFRVIINSAKGGEIWNSSNNMNYMTVVGDVKPSKAGGIERYEMLWNGTTNGKQTAPPGHYTAQLMIPSRPLPYSANVEFDWKGK